MCILSACWQGTAIAADRDGVILDHPPLADEIGNDALLRHLKLIAWVADDNLLPREGKRGFPHGGSWLERNKRFTNDFSNFFTAAGPAGIASAVATRSEHCCVCLRHLNIANLMPYSRSHAH